MAYIDTVISKYLDALAARQPTPGGGSAAALVAASGTALMSMVANYTAGNAKYEKSASEIALLLIKVESARSRLQEIIDEDCISYGRLAQAMKQSLGDGRQLKDLYKEALQPPLEVCTIAAECLSLCPALALRGNSSLVTDTAIAAILLEAAFLSAKFNVYINLKMVEEIQYVENIHTTLAGLEEKISVLKEETLEACEDIISK